MFFHLQVGLPMPLTITGPPIPVRPNTFWRKSRRIWVAKSERWRLWHDFSMAKISTNQSRPSWITVYIIAGLIFRETNGSIISHHKPGNWGRLFLRGARGQGGADWLICHKFCMVWTHKCKTPKFRQASRTHVTTHQRCDFLRWFIHTVGFSGMESMNSIEFYIWFLPTHVSELSGMGTKSD